MSNVIRLRHFPAKPLSEVERFERLLCRTEEVDGLAQAIHLSRELIRAATGALVHERGYDSIAMLASDIEPQFLFDSSGLRSDAEAIAALLADVRIECGAAAVCRLSAQIIDLAVGYLAAKVSRAFARDSLALAARAARPAA